MLLAANRVEHLSLDVVGSLDKSVIACFAYLSELTHFTVKNSGDEETTPLCVLLLSAVNPFDQFVSL